MSVLTLEPLAGLGNRMRAIDSALRLARDAGMSLRLLWRVDRQLGSPVEALFVVPETIACVTTVDLLAGARSAALEAVTARRRRSARFIDQPQVRTLLEQGFDFRSLAGHGSVHIATWEHFHCALPAVAPAPPQRGHWLQPAPALRARIERIASTFGRTVGVHVRRTDHPAQHLSPTPAFVRRMCQILERGDADGFFLATDDPAEEAALLRRFAGMIVRQPKRSLRRHEQAAAEDAVVDLFCLARTTRVLGTRASSFGGVAARVGCIPFEAVSGDPATAPEPGPP